MYRRACGILAIALLLMCFASAESGVLDHVWNITLKGDLPDKVDVDYGQVIRTGFDKGRILVVTSANPATGQTRLKNKVYAYNGNGSIYWAVGMDEWIRSAKVYDVDRDETDEVIVTTGQSFQAISRGKIHIIGSYGNMLRRVSDTSIYETVMITDLNGDRYYELLAGSEGKASLFGIGLEKIETFPKKGGGLLPKKVDGIAAGQLDMEGAEEVAVAADKIYVTTLNFSTLSTVDFQENRPLLKKGYKYVEIGDFTNNPRNDLFIVTNEDKIYDIVINESSYVAGTDLFSMEKVWKLNPECDISLIKTLNADEDSEKEVFIGCENRIVKMIDGHGKIMWSYVLDSRPVGLELKDLDEDGVDDIVILTKTGTIYLLNKGGEFLWRYETNRDSSLLMIGDVAGESDNEVMVVDDSTTLYLFRTNKTFIYRKKGDSLYNIGQKYYWEGLYQDSIEKLTQARSMYNRVNYSFGITEADKLIEKIDVESRSQRRKEADIFYEKAQESFIEGDYELSSSYLSKAKTLYREFGESEGVLKVELMELRIKRIIDEQRMGTTIPSTASVETLPDTSGQQNYSIMVAGGVTIIIFIILLFQKKRKDGGSEVITEIQGGGGGDEWGEI